MRRSGRVSGAAALCVGLLASPISALLLPGCTSWQRTRTEFVEPIQSLLHYQYPQALVAMDRDRVLSLFSSDSAEEQQDAAQPSLDILLSFNKIEAARALIKDSALEGEVVRARVNLQVEGVGTDDSRLSLTQEKDVTCVRSPTGWLISSDRSRPAQLIRPPLSQFVDETLSRGLFFEHRAKPVPDRNGELQRFVPGSGVAVADVDNDGTDDAVLLSGDRIELFLNKDGQFHNVSERWGLGLPLSGALTSPLLADVDNDGRKDLLVAAVHSQPKLFKNQGGRFALVDGSGLQTTAMTVGVCAADFDADGALDFYFGNNADLLRKVPEPMGFAANAEANQLYLNNGDGTFRDVTDSAGVGSTGWSLVCTAADYDQDGDVDLFVGNDFGADVLYQNDGTARFRSVTREAGINVPVASMSSDWGDFDNDGDLDLFIAGMASSWAWIIEQDEFPTPAPWLVDVLFGSYVRRGMRQFFDGNRLYENLGDGTFREVSTTSRTANSGWAWATLWLDFDNDGQLDLYSLNGFLSGAQKKEL